MILTGALSHSASCLEGVSADGHLELPRAVGRYGWCLAGLQITALIFVPTVVGSTYGTLV
jgi:hypothetical protein